MLRMGWAGMEDGGGAACRGRGGLIWGLVVRNDCDIPSGGLWSIELRRRGGIYYPYYYV